MSSLRELALDRGTKQASEIAYELGRRFDAGWTEDELRKRLDRPLPMDAAVGSISALLRHRTMEIPLMPPWLRSGGGRGGKRVEELQQELAEDGAELYARQGERPDAIDIAQVPGGWRAYRDRVRQDERHGE